MSQKITITDLELLRILSWMEAQTVELDTLVGRDNEVNVRTLIGLKKSSREFLNHPLIQSLNEET